MIDQNLLYINTTRKNTISIVLIKEKDVFDQLNLNGDYKLSEKLLTAINKLLQNNNLKITQISGLITVTGPGPFTSLRIAVSVTNTLAYTLKIPVIGIKNLSNKTDIQLIKQGMNKIKKMTTCRLLLPYYDREPNIT